MFQESVDRSHGSSKSDLVLLIALVVVFVLTGFFVAYLEKTFSSNIPRYVYIALVLAALYLIYRLRIIGYRYTIFHEAPKPVYDPRFDDMMLHEDYPYPVGTVVLERIVSAKGTILFTIDKSEIEALLKPGEEYSAADEAVNLACMKGENAHSLVFRKDGKLIRAFFAPSEEFLGYIEKIMSCPASEDA